MTNLVAFEGRLWQTKAMSITPAEKGAARKRFTSGRKPKLKLQALQTVMQSRAVQEAIKTGNTHFVFPKMSGAAAAELMKSAGILTPAGKLTKSYR